MATFTVDGHTYTGRQGANLLWSCLDQGLYIPSLCSIRNSGDLQRSSCRLCLVEIEGTTSPVTACSQTVKDGIAIHLNTAKIVRTRSTIFELLLSHHCTDCANCNKNGKCELQRIAAHLGLKLKLTKLNQIPRHLPIDASHLLFSYNPNKCVLCGKCVWVCQSKGSGIIDFSLRGIGTAVCTFANAPFSSVKCDSCLACVAICPVGSLTLKK